jgi:hypothetical protein
MIEGTPGGGTINEAKGFHMVPDSNTVAVDGVETAISGFSLNDPDSITADGKFVTWGALFFDVPSFGLADTVTVEVTLTVRGVTTSAMHLLCPAAGCPP